MFTTKQSDIFYNDQTKEMFVCKVSSISAQRCEGSSDIVYGALPIVYKINKNTNYQSLIYPKNLTTFFTDSKSDLYDIVPSNCYADGTDFAHVTKPLINYNKNSDRYSVTFIGKYAAESDGFGVLNYIFQYIDTDFHLLDSQISVPKAKATKTPPFTFNAGYLNSDLIIGGNRLRWNDPVDTAYAERVTDYIIKPTHIDYNNSLGFNLMTFCPHVPPNCLTAASQYPFLWSGGYITYNPKYTAFDPAHDIRVDFRARSFNVPSMTAFRSTQSDNSDVEPSRFVDKATTTDGLSGAGSGFCVYFYKTPTSHPVEYAREGIVEPNGIGSTLGYAIAGNVGSEINGELTSVEGLVVNSSGNIGGQTGPNAESFLGVGFDIRGDFCTTSESKEGWLSANDAFKAPTTSTWTTSPCSVGIRGNRDHYTRVLTCVPMSTVVAASAVPMHEDASTSNGTDVAFQDYRVDLTNKGTRVTVYNKLTSAIDYNTILQFDLNKTYGSVGYDAWGNIGDPLIANPTLTPLNVGLTFTTSNYCSYFELSSFEVTGVKIGKPNKIPKEIDNTTTVEYIEESSANLRRDLIEIPLSATDVTMLITRESLIDRIDLCGNPLPPVEYEVKAEFTGTKNIINLNPGEVKEPVCQPGWYSSWPLDIPDEQDIMASLELAYPGEDRKYDYPHEHTEHAASEAAHSKKYLAAAQASMAGWSGGPNPNIWHEAVLDDAGNVSTLDHIRSRAALGPSGVQEWGYHPIGDGPKVTSEQYSKLSAEEKKKYIYKGDQYPHLNVGDFMVYGPSRNVGVWHYQDQTGMPYDRASSDRESVSDWEASLQLSDPADPSATTRNYFTANTIDGSFYLFEFTGSFAGLPIDIGQEVFDWRSFLVPGQEFRDTGYIVRYKWRTCDVLQDVVVNEPEPKDSRCYALTWNEFMGWPTIITNDESTGTVTFGYPEGERFGVFDQTIIKNGWHIQKMEIHLEVPVWGSAADAIISGWSPWVSPVGFPSLVGAKQIGALSFIMDEYSTAWVPMANGLKITAADQYGEEKKCYYIFPVGSVHNVLKDGTMEGLYQSTIWAWRGGKKVYPWYDSATNNELLIESINTYNSIQQYVNSIQALQLPEYNESVHLIQGTGNPNSTPDG